MNVFRQTSIVFKLRLIITLTSVTALLLLFCGITLYEFTRFKGRLTGELAVLSQIVADRATAALAFNDRTTARETLAALGAKTSIVGASIYSRSGEVFAQYSRNPAATVFVPPAPRTNAHFFKKGHLHLFRDIVLDGEKIGTVYIMSDLQDINTRFRQYSGIAAVLVLVSLLVAYFLSLRFQKVITEPVVHLVKTAKAVSENKDYTIRARKQSDDELGMLISGFNEMLSQIQQRDAELLHEAEELARLATAIEQSHETILISGTDGIIRYVNPALEHLTGYSRDELIGKNLLYFESGTEQENLYREAFAIVSKGEAWSGHIKLYHRDRSASELNITVSPVRDQSGKIISFVSIGRDITKELRMEEQLRQAQKMEAIGTLAGGIAHDFNNILAAIIGYTEMAHDDLPQDSPARDNLAQVLKSSIRARDLVRQILAFSRKGAEELKPIRLHAIVKETARLLRASLPTTIDIRQTMQENSDIVMANATHIHQIIMNLGTNAAHAMQKKGGVLEIGLMPVTLEDKDAGALQDINPGPYVELTVSDTGCGIDPKIIDRIFDPFFTTKDKAKGTGMGLAVVHGIVKSLGGAITVASAPGKGTAFSILLPRTEVPEAEEQETAAAIPHKGHERVLFVDDEVTLMNMVRQLLQALGYSVVAEHSSRAALELFRTQPDAFDIVITDQTMPHLTGYELARELLSIRNNIPIILCSGFSEAVTPEKAKAAGIKEFVMKPYNKKELAESIRRVLDQ